MPSDPEPSEPATGDMSPPPQSADMSAHSKDVAHSRTSLLSGSWHHAPLHRLSEQGVYMVTAGTMGKEHFFRGNRRLDLLHNSLLEYAADSGWNMQAWAVFPNHYHFVAASPDNPENLRNFLGKLHMKTAKAINELDGKPGRKIWHQFWDSHITYENSYWPRLRYVQENPVRHGLVPVATQYRWCSAAWFERTAEPAIRRKMQSYQCDRLHVHDEF